MWFSVFFSNLCLLEVIYYEFYVCLLWVLTFYGWITWLWLYMMFMHVWYYDDDELVLVMSIVCVWRNFIDLVRRFYGSIYLVCAIELRNVLSYKAILNSNNDSYLCKGRRLYGESGRWSIIRSLYKTL